MNTDVTVQALMSRIKDMSKDASPEELAYMAKAMESVGGKATLLDVMQAGDGQLSAIKELSTEQQEKLLAALEEYKVSLDQETSGLLEEIQAAGQKQVALIKELGVYVPPENEDEEDDTPVVKTVVEIRDNSAKCIGFPENDSGQSGRSLYHMLFKMSDGSIRGVGRNIYGSMGLGANDDTFWTGVSVLLPVAAKDDVVERIYIDSHSSTLLMKSGDVYVTGYESYGSMAQGDDARQNTYVKVPLPAKCIKVAVGSPDDGRYRTNLYLLEDGRCFSSGYNGYGQCGVNDTTNRLSPALVHGSGDWKDIGSSGSRYTSCWAINQNNEIFVWGYNGYGNLGQDNTVNVLAPVKLAIPNVKKATFSNRTSHTCAYILTHDGEVWVAGMNNLGQLGIGHLNQQNTFVKMDLLDVKDLVADGTQWGHAFALLNDGTIRGWGYNGYGNLGIAQGNTTNQTLPSIPENFLQDGETIQKVVVASYNYTPMSFVITSSNRVLACGDNSNGHLGFGNNASHRHVFEEVPVRINKDTRIKDIFINGYGYIGTSYHAIYLLTEAGEVLACGYDHKGQLGTGNDGANHLSTFNKVAL